jgi:hypothetical protein
VTTYALWTHRWAATFCAVRLSEGCVTGLCGPLPRAPREARGDLSGYPYDERPEALRCAQMHPEPFALAEAWRRGRGEGWPPLG